MSDQLSEIYFYALDLGIPAEKYWELSINEIIDTMDSLQRQRKRKEKQKIMDNFILAEILTAYQKAEEDRKWEEYKENRRAYMAEWNRRRHQ